MFLNTYRVMVNSKFQRLICRCERRNDGCYSICYSDNYTKLYFVKDVVVLRVLDWVRVKVRNSVRPRVEFRRSKNGALDAEQLEYVLKNHWGKENIDQS